MEIDLRRIMKTYLILLLSALTGLSGLLGCQSSGPKYFVALQCGDNVEAERGFNTLAEAQSYVEYYRANHNYIIILK